MRQVHPAHQAIFHAVLYVALGTLFLGFVYVIASNNKLINDIRESQKKRADTFALLVSCTDGRGECSRRQQAVVRKALARDMMINVASVACADQPGAQTPVEIRECVRRTLERTGHE